MGWYDEPEDIKHEYERRASENKREAGKLWHLYKDAVSSFIISCFLVVPVSYSADIEVGKDIFKLLLQANITDNNYKGNSEMGRKICEAYKGSRCYYVSSLPEGICRAAKGEYCTYVSTIGEALCRAGGASNCTYVNSIGEGFCRMMHVSNCSYVSSLSEGICKGLGGSYCSGSSLENFTPKDVSFAWDKFTAPNAYGNIWACRGIQTGQFVENSKCSGPQEDKLWPND